MSNKNDKLKNITIEDSLSKRSHDNQQRLTKARQNLQNERRTAHYTSNEEPSFIILGVFMHGTPTQIELKLKKNTKLSKITFAPRNSSCSFSTYHTKMLAIKLHNAIIVARRFGLSPDEIIERLTPGILDLDCVINPNTNAGTECSIALTEPGYPRLLEITHNDKNYNKIYSASIQELKSDPTLTIYKSMDLMFHSIGILYDSNNPTNIPIKINNAKAIEKAIEKKKPIPTLPNDMFKIFVHEKKDTTDATTTETAATTTETAAITTQALYDYYRWQGYTHIIIYDFSCDNGSDTNVNNPRGGKKWIKKNKSRKRNIYMKKTRKNKK